MLSVAEQRKARSFFHEKEKGTKKPIMRSMQKVYNFHNKTGIFLSLRNFLTYTHRTQTLPRLQEKYGRNSKNLEDSEDAEKKKGVEHYELRNTDYPLHVLVQVT